MKVKIAFDPESLKEADEAYPAFQAGGLTLKLWALWKRNFNTSQHFRYHLITFARYMESVDKGEIGIYNTIDSFVITLKDCGFIERFPIGVQNEAIQWALDHWDYFNPNIQKSIEIEYSAIRTITETLRVGGDELKPAEGSVMAKQMQEQSE